MAKKDKHHIIPSSRGGDSGLNNIVLVDKRAHAFYHALFNNRNPEEILDYLVRDFWGNDTAYLYRYLQNRKP